MAYTVEQLRDLIRDYDGESRTRNRRSNPFYSDGDLSKDQITDILTDPRTYEGLSEADIQDLAALANEEYGFWDSFSHSNPFGEGKFHKIREAIYNAEKQAGRVKKDERRDRYEGYRDDIDSNYRKTQAQVDKSLDYYGQQQDRYEGYRDDIEDQRNDTLANIDDLFNQMNTRLQEQRKINSGILEDAKRFNMSPSQAQAQYEQNQVALENRLKQQASMRGQGVTKDPLSNRQDIGRELGQQQLHADKIREDLARQQLLMQAKQQHLGNLGQIDNREYQAKNNQVNQTHNANQNYLNNNFRLDGVLSNLEMAKLRMVLQNNRLTNQNLQNNMILDNILDKNDANYALKQQAINNIISGQNTAANNQLANLGLGAGKALVGGLTKNPKMIGSGIGDLTKGVAQYKSPTATPDLSFLDNISGDDLTGLYNSLFGNKDALGGTSVKLPHEINNQELTNLPYKLPNMADNKYMEIIG